MLFKIFSVLAFVVAYVAAETHTVSFVNKCGRGTPALILQGRNVYTGAPYTSNSPISGGIAYLQTGVCGLNGENCTLVELTLTNPTTPGSGSSVDISLIPPHAFSVATGFAYSNGCNGSGADCTTPECTSAFRQPSDTFVQVACQQDNVNLVITFCG